MPLRVPVREAARANLERWARAAVRQVVSALRDAQISARVRAQRDERGHPLVAVLVRGAGTAEAELILPPTIKGMSIRVR